MKFGLDVGSTTAKVVALNDDDEIIFSRYERHHSDARGTLIRILEQAQKELGDITCELIITGSAGLGLAESLSLPFVQEVIASKNAIKKVAPETDVVIELGGEDAKIIFFDQGGIDQRMNGTCAGGTGAFIDQMASLLDTDASGLNELAKNYTRLYPIASRCGVFAKSDIQPLLNEGAAKEDIAASIFQSVVNQTISGLACGHTIKGNVAFLGGPLSYLSELRTRFIETLRLGQGKGEAIIPENNHLLVAYGAAIADEAPCKSSISELITTLQTNAGSAEIATQRLRPLFANQDERDEFNARHAIERLPERRLEDTHGNCFLGIDAGSTTFKLTLIDENGNLIYQRYRNNGGDVLGCAIEELKALYAEIAQRNSELTIARALVTGYGEQLLQEALAIDEGEVETIAHLRAARQLEPDVNLILDIGGQDMKCIHIKDGVIDSIMLNEACSSGCGSFIETYALSMGKPVEEFAQLACMSTSPVDLGSRCTVFMNSRIKQAQREGASLEDVAAGLSYSVIKNALFKVMKAHTPEALGPHIVVQGGTFANDSVLRAFELLCKQDVIRPEQAGLMGAYGAALLARDRYNALNADERAASAVLPASDLDKLEVHQSHSRCKGCENNCALTINRFDYSDGTSRRFVTGNRCERGAGNHDKQTENMPNLFAHKYERTFGYTPLTPEQASRGTVGIPRALNMYENYPFWFTFFTQLGFRVELSSKSSRSIYLKGMESIPSESVCYPAKIAHGHVMELLERKVDFIWMPCIRIERKEDEEAANAFNCPIVSSYPETLRLNIDDLNETGTPLLDPYIPYNSEKHLLRRMKEIMQELYAQHPEFKGTAPSDKEVKEALEAAWAEDKNFKEDIRRKGKETLEWLNETGHHGVVLAGRPYHLDAEINHAIPELLCSMGVAVFTEDSVSWMQHPEHNLRTVDQWMYHSRLYSAAKFVTTQSNLDLVQLNSFGCGLDAITTDQVREILEDANKPYTVLKIDEVSNLGAVRIRLRSLMAALRERGDQAPTPVSTAFPRAAYTKQMREERYDIIAPQMSPVHFELLESAFRAEGYNLHVLPSVDPKAVDAGLRYVNNDICYPSILVAGQIMEAIESGDYDLDHTAILIVQTGGGCRATNYISLIRKALKEFGHPDIPVISMTFVNTGESNPGWTYSVRLAKRACYAIVVGDLLMQCLYRTRPYEAKKGSADALYRQWMDASKEGIITWNHREFKKNCRAIIHDFDTLPLTNDASKPRVGIVGEILAKFHPTANNQLVEVIESEGCEAVVPGLGDFFQYAALNAVFRRKDLDGGAIAAKGGQIFSNFIDWLRKDVYQALRESKRFEVPASVKSLAEKASKIVQLCNNMGEGWLLTGEMIGLVEEGAPNIVICSPFGCLPNHVIGKSVIKAMRTHYPESNIAAIDYDPGASEVNQINRIKLMISVAKERFDAKKLTAAKPAPALEA